MDERAPVAGTPGGQAHGHTPVPSSRAGRAWLAVAAGIAVLVGVLVFIIENSKSVPVTFFGAAWKIPLAIDLLLSAVAGGLIVFLLGTVRILQLRRVARHRPLPPAPREDSSTVLPGAALPGSAEPQAT
ncbi:MAG: LapA family protein [Acidimicrobiales bacterium]